MGRAEFYNPATGKREPIKAGSIVNSSGLEYTPDQIKGIDNKINNLSTDVNDHKADGTQHKKTARFVIGTSTAGWTASDCDYLCDGTADQTEINAAITALPATGGEIVILDGTYNITAKINVTKDNVSIRGNGNATILKRMWDSSVAEGVVSIVSNSCKIRNLRVDGNKTVYTSSSNGNIYLKKVKYASISDVRSEDGEYGVYISSSTYTVVNNCFIINCYYGIKGYQSNYANMSNNTIDSCFYGFNKTYSNYNKVVGNQCYNNDYGLLYYDSSNTNNISSNIFIRGTGLPSDYTANQHTIKVSNSNNNLIVSNICLGKAVVIAGSSNTEVNNKSE